MTKTSPTAPRPRQKTAEDVEDFKYFNTLDDWSDRWEFNKTGWTLEHPNPFLVRHFRRLVDRVDKDKEEDEGIESSNSSAKSSASSSELATNSGESSYSSTSPLDSASDDPVHPESSRSIPVGPLHSISRRPRVLVPLCGKSRDLKWLFDAGVDVVGVEWCLNVVEELFGELPFPLPPPSAMGDFRVFTASDDRFRVLQGDFFAITTAALGGAVDAVWDRDALSAVNVGDRRRYVETLRRVLRGDGRVLLDSPAYDENEYRGDPHPIVDEEIEALFGSDFKVEFLEATDALDEVWRGLGLTTFVKRVHLLTLKG